jgi:alpha-L-fucosidase
MEISRKEFIQAALASSLAGFGHAGLEVGLCAAETADPPAEIPSYLKSHEATFRKDPRAAAIEWLVKSRWGLFVHYSLHSLRGITAKQAAAQKRLSKEDWKKLKQGTAEEYARLEPLFTARRFDADFITDLALEAQMGYINFTTRHLGDMYMFRTAQSKFTSLNSPARRDLVAELAEQCQKKALGLFLYCPPDVARTEPQATFDRNMAVVKELLTQYGPVAGIWLDGIGSYYEEPQSYSRLGEIYKLIRSLQPQCLISFKQGTGVEDFVAPEGLMHTKSDAIAQDAWRKMNGKPGDICTNLQTAPPAWLYMEGCEHLNSDQVLQLLADAFAQKANLTINTGPLPDGSIHPDDVKALREAGAHIRKNGFPAPARLTAAARSKLKMK